MPSRFPLLAGWSASAATILLAAILSAFTIARLGARRARRNARERRDLLVESFGLYLESHLSGRELRQEANSCDERIFWSALETYRLGPFRGTMQRVAAQERWAASPSDRSRWRALSAALVRTSHARNECHALNDDSMGRQELAIRRLSLLPSRRSRRKLRAVLSRGPESVAYAAALGLARFRDGCALDWILDHPGALCSRTTRAYVALLRAFGRGALPRLAAALERSADERLACASIETLGLARYHASAAAIERRLCHPELEVRVAAARALGRIRAPESLRALIAALADPHWQVRAQAARAVAPFGSLDAVEPLSALLSDRSWWVRRHAAYALVSSGAAGEAALRHAAETSTDPYARDMAREVLSGGFPVTSLVKRR